MNLRPQGVNKLAGEDRSVSYSGRCDYRIIYTIRDKELIVLIVNIDDGKEVYR